MRFRSTGRMTASTLLTGALLVVYLAPGLLPAVRDAAHSLDHGLNHGLDHARGSAPVDVTPPPASYAAAHRLSGHDAAEPQAEKATHGHTRVNHDHDVDGAGNEHAAGSHRAVPAVPQVHGHDGLTGLLILLAPAPRPDGRLHQEATPTRLTVDIHQVVRVPALLPQTLFEAAAGAPGDVATPTADAAEPLTPPPRV